MNTLYLVLSPKKKWSNSSYLSAVSRPFSGKDSSVIHYQGPKYFSRIMEHLDRACQLVLVMPLYVDGIPSHVLELMEHIQGHIPKHPSSVKVYSIINCGFYEGAQCEYAMEMVECWCLRCGFQFMGGRGIGAGEMFGVIRLNLVVGAFMLLLDFLMNLTQAVLSHNLSFATIFGGMHPIGGIITIALGVLWSLGGWFAAAQVGRSAGKGVPCRIAYTTVTVCPAILFVFFASLYWILRSLLIHHIPVWKLFRKIYNT